MTLTKNKYYFEALDNYPYYLSECLEALSYALSYDPEDPDSLCLMGRIHSEIVKDYETAKSYFAEAMQYNVTNINTPQHYIKCLLENEDLEEAGKLIAYAMKIKGIDKYKILTQQSILNERRLEFKKAQVSLREARKYARDQSMLDLLKTRQKFIKSLTENKKKITGKKKKKKSKA